MNGLTKNLITKISPALFLLIAGFATVMAQGGVEAQQQQPPAQQQQQTGDLLRQLNLTPDQIERIRAIQLQSRDERRLVSERLRDARRALDEAIYQDNVDESLVEQRARELAAAQIAAERFRAMTELRIRRVLTQEQLVTFRELRQHALLMEQEQRRERRLEGEPPARQELRRERMEQRQGGQIQGGQRQQNNPPPPRERPGGLLRRP